MKRSAPLRTLSPLRSRSRVKPTNPKRAARKYRRNYAGEQGGDKAAWIRSLACVRCGRTGELVAAHVVPRGMGGAHGSARDLVPLCAHPCHHEQELMSVERYRQTFGIDLSRYAAQLEEQWAEIARENRQS